MRPVANCRTLLHKDSRRLLALRTPAIGECLSRQAGQWATLNYPNAAFTHLAGISNAGAVVGNALDTDGGFLYKNGVFKNILDPKGAPTSVLGISPRQGLILGTSSSGGFIATCK